MSGELKVLAHLGSEFVDVGSRWDEVSIEVDSQVHLALGSWLLGRSLSWFEDEWGGPNAEWGLGCLFPAL